MEGLHLESLHLSFRMLIDEPDLKERLHEIVKGEIGDAKSIGLSSTVMSLNAQRETNSNRDVIVIHHL